ncbi:MAG TPA: methyltransferase domain-containing protein, partial [Acidimicrobiales bacterium]|nr:methyltransferase domain-containing protein [Acidimicrobiales bacterium]
VRRRPVGRRLAVTGTAVGAYSVTGAAWQRGPGRIYDRLAGVVVAHSPVPLGGRRVLDVGAGTGAASRAALEAGAAAVVAVDAALGMLGYRPGERPPAAAGDALALPFAGASFDAAVAAFSLNHLTDPVRALRELCRVTRAGAPLVAGTYAADDGHPVKAAVEAALAARGWEPEPWYLALRTDAVPLLSTVEGCMARAAAAGLDAACDHVRVPFPDLGPGDLVAWRLGMAQHAPFVARLPDHERELLAAEVVARLGGTMPPLVRSILVLSAVRP